MSQDPRYQVVLGDGLGPVGVELVFTYRLLGREEYRQIDAMAETDEEFQEMVCQLCVEDDFDWRGGLAGPATVLCDLILEGSGLNEGQADMFLAIFRDELYTNPDYQKDCIIVEAFPNLTIEEVQNWPVVKHLYYYSRAEYILTAIRGKRLSIVNPEDIMATEQLSRVERPRVEDDFSFDAPQQEPKQQDGAMSEAQLLAMLGVGADTIANDIDKESIKFHQHKDSITGQFD